MLELRVIFHGRVHGVGFRATVCSFAQQMGLKGFVRNKKDGTVELCAQGEKNKLKQLLEKLKTTFDGDFIEKIESNFSEGEKAYNDFSITF